MSKKVNFFLIYLMLNSFLTISSCGWQVRGNETSGGDIGKIWLGSKNIQQPLLQDLTQALNKSGLLLTKRKQDADYLVVITKHRNNRKTGTYNTSLRTAEYRLLEEVDFTKKVFPIYDAIKKVSQDDLTKDKSTIGFVGAPWTLLVYMINKKSPKIKLIDNFFENKDLISKLLLIIEKFLKIHIKKQVESGAEIIQIFDSWAGLLDNKDLPYYIFEPTLKLVNFVKSLNVPVICFPRGINDYKSYCETINPDVICIDYEVDPTLIQKTIKIPVQGGMDPKILLTDKEKLKIEAKRYLDIFKDHPYIFNLGHGVLPETDPNMMDYLVKMVKDY